MQVSVETTQGLERRLTITVPADKIEKEYNSRLNQVAKTRRIDGFRPGKAPKALIQKMYGESIVADVADAVMQRHFVEALVAEKLNPVGAPTLEPNQLVPGSDFTFTVSFEVYPEFKVQNLDAIKVEKPVATVSDADLDKMLTTLRKQHASWVDADEAAANDLRVNMDFVGSVDGEEFEGGKAEGFALVLGAGRMIPGFEAGILGKKAGESFDIEVTFPEDYHAENLKGKAAKFAIKLNKVEKQDLPELDAEFIKRFGVEDGSVESLKAEIRKNMERELTQALKGQVKEQILSGLLEQNLIDVPKAAVTREVEALRQQALQRFGAANSKNVPQLPDELFQEQAERRVRVGLLLGEVIREQDIKADDARVKTLIESLATAYEDPSEVVDYYFQNERLLNNMRDLAVEDQAIEFLLSQAQVTEKATSFDEVINKAGAAA
ncbi:trigger factor [Tolumonas auensis DSM 9187]|uniref:Trigger factor n=1 Tax=Tolumonas auensis (strain DSM 9187 / NBRC 110442 / TA 4) TaxID=595494 RepID=TIG_TOLAT|nr:trigger factor [Tolumonas auensis]C4LDB2.1 RecName: Full=Trigger factor; Short=TF; AltName: Full=PPIase [Tolumonas auensis DSM 9187]ACQ92708.1 trigger factor [Tolumonas auensis DSM 9187]NCB58337.1 trigger factor [Gammaproteobacteria bacterium]